MLKSGSRLKHAPSLLGLNRAGMPFPRSHHHSDPVQQNLSHVFAGQQFGIREIDEKIRLVSFMHYDLGFFDHETGRVECAENPFQAKGLPMPSE